MAELRESSALACADTRVERIEVAGQRFALLFACSELRDALWPALAHLAADSERPEEVTVRVWDSAVTGHPAPPRPGTPPTSASGAPCGGTRRAASGCATRPSSTS